MLECVLYNHVNNVMTSAIVSGETSIAVTQRETETRNKEVM